MGMFDYVTCHYPLPGVPDWVTEWQTKDLEPCFMATHVVTEDGALQHADGEEEFAGVVEFYTSNITGSGGGGYVLREGTGSKGVSINCTATFEGGKLVDIKVQTETDETTPTFATWAEMEENRSWNWGKHG